MPLFTMDKQILHRVERINFGLEKELQRLIEGKPGKIRDLAISIQEYILGLDAAISENPKKYYVGYKTSQNIVCMEVKQKKIILYIKLAPNALGELPTIARDVTSIYRKDTRANRLNVQKGFSKLRQLRAKTEEEGWLRDGIPS